MYGDMNLKELSCRRDNVLETASCSLIAPEQIELRTGWVKLLPDDSLEFGLKGRKYHFDLRDVSQRAKAHGLLRSGYICVAQKLSQLNNGKLFNLRMVFFATAQMKNEMEGAVESEAEGEIGILPEEPVLASLREKMQNAGQNTATLMELLTFQLGTETFFAYAVKRPYQEKKRDASAREKAADVPEIPEQPMPAETEEAVPESPQQPDIAERTFQIYGNGCMLQVRMVGEGNEAYLSGQKLVWNPKNIPVLRLSKRKLSFGDRRMRVAQSVRDELHSSPGYLDLWNQYSEQEGELLLLRARKVGVLERSGPISLDGEKVVIFLTENSAESLKQLEEGDCLAFTKERPKYLDNEKISWKEYADEKEERAREYCQDKTQREITMRIESKGERKVVLTVLNNDDGVRPEILDGRVISLSIYGDATQIERRKKSRDLIRDENAANPNIVYAIEGIPYLSRDFAKKRPHIKPLSPRVREKVFHNDPTLKQREAIDIALNTPDIAIIQGPPGTGKTTVITAIIERLNELADKSSDLQGTVLVTSLQHDAVANIQSRLHINSLPTVKFGKRAGEEDDLDESVEKWRQENAEKLRQSNPMLRESDSEKNLDRVFGRYLRTPNVQNALRFLQCAETAVPEKAVKVSIRAIRQELELQEFLEQENQQDERDQLIRKIRSLRTTPAGFSDDGPKTAKALQQFLKKKELLPLDSPILRHLQQARDMEKGEVEPEFLIELARDKNELLARCVQEPFYRRPQPRVDIVELYNEVRALAKPTLNAENRILAQYLEQLEENPEAVNESLKRYCFVYSSTLQQSEGKEIRRAKGVRPNETLRYDTVIVDEAARANPCDLMISMAQASKRIILVGDHRQLPHIYDEEVFQELKKKQNVQDQGDIRVSMFQNLLGKVKQLEEKDGICRNVTLDAQYRMHPELGNFVSEQFYRPNGEGFDSPLPAELFAQSICREPMCWLNVREGKEEHPAKSKSLRRMSEVELIVKRLEKNLTDASCQGLSFGVISFYRAQVDEIRQKIRRSEILNAEMERGRLRVGTVDAFQGMEFDVIYLSVVRSEVNTNEEARTRLFAAADVVNAGMHSPKSEEYRKACEEIDEVGRKTFGFITSQNRLCVALSRQKRLLVVVGNGELFGIRRNGMFEPRREAEICVPAMVRLYEKCLEKGVVEGCRV